MWRLNLYRSLRVADFTDRFPSCLSHSDHDTPVPTWGQVTRSADSTGRSICAQVYRIISGIEDEQAALDVWNTWPSRYQRSFAILIDKIYHEGWLESVGQIAGWPWDGGFFFWPRTTQFGTLDKVLNAKTDADGVYTRCGVRSGLAAYLSRWRHRAWKRSWIENDTPFASLHTGIFENGSAEVHLDLFNPAFTNGAPAAEVSTLPAVGSFNRKLFGLHRQWETGRHASVSRTSANFYHLMRGRVPLCF